MKLFRSHYKYILFFTFLSLLLITGFTGCRSGKDIVKRPSASDSKILEQLINGDDNSGKMDSKVVFRLSPKEGVSVDMKGSLRLKRDSCMIFSFQPFAGIEAVRCLIRKDSIFIVSRLHQVYSAECLQNNKYSQFLNFELLQAVLTNKIFIPGDTKPSINDLKRFEWHQKKTGEYFRWSKDPLTFDFYLNEAKQYSSFKATEIDQKIMLEVVYSLFQEESTMNFPTRLDFKAEGLDKKYKLQITYLKPNFDSKVDFRFEIPSRYKKVTTPELIQRFQKML